MIYTVTLSNLLFNKILKGEFIIIFFLIWQYATDSNLMSSAWDIAKITYIL